MVRTRARWQGPGRRAAAVALAGSLLVVAAAWAGGTWDGRDDADTRVNVAGRQRMLTERVAVEYLLAHDLAHDASDRARAEHLRSAATAARVLLASEEALVSGGPVPDLDGGGPGAVLAPAGQGARDARADLQDPVRRYAALVEQPPGSATEVAEHRREVLALRGELVPALDVATFGEESLATAARADAVRATGVALLAAACLVGLVLLLAVVLARRRASARADTTFRALVTGTRDGVVLLDDAGVVRYASPAAAALALSPRDLPGQTLGDVIGARTSAPAAAALAAALGTGGGPVSQEDQDLVLADGRTLSARLSDVRADPDLRGVVVHLRDVTDDREAAREAARRHAIVELLQASAAAANRSAGLEEALRLVLDAVCRHFGWKVGHAYLVAEQGRPLSSSGLWAGLAVQDPSATSGAFAEFRRVSESITFPSGVGLPGRVLAAKVPMWVTDVTTDPNFPRAPQARAAGLAAAAAFPLMLGDEVLAVLEFFDTAVVVVDPEVLEVMGHLGTQLGRVVERDRAGEQLRRLARTDDLTGLLNRGAFRRVLAETDGADRPTALLYVDLDDFKDVNDTLGHAAGDELIAAAARRLEGAVGPDDVVARLGGDEFAVLVRSPEDLGQLADRVLAAFEEPFRLVAEVVRVRASAGLAVRAGVRPGQPRHEDLMVQADVALYAAKERGKSCWVRYDEALGEQVRRRTALDEALRAAVDAQAFVLHYQPVVETRTGRVVSAEALLRWPGQDLGPAQFVPRLEASGLIVEVGRWVLAEACRQGARWAAAGLERTVAVNVAPRQLLDPGIEDDVRSALAGAGLAPSRLVLEVTETAATDGMAVGVLERLRDLGVGVAVDDFGTGYSSLSRLITLPTTVLKIDRSLVRHVGRSRRDTDLVRAVVDLSRSLDLVVVAEGVETPEQRAALDLMGCHRIQGYLTGRPGPADAIEADPAPPRCDEEAAARPRV